MAHTSRGTLRIGDRSAHWVREGVLDGRPVVALAHGAGAAMDSSFLESCARDLVAHGLTVVRFHFLYMQQRVDEGNRRPPDRAPLLLDTWRGLLDRVAVMKGAGPVVAAGKSMGGRMASMLLAEGRAPDVRGAVYLGYPLHPAGRPERERADHLPAVPVPQLFVSGTRDALAGQERLEQIVGGLEAAELLLIPGGDHSFARRKKDQLEFGEAPDWPRVVADFVQRVC
jgi:predicted alpha/beta-hydrolase family hydrolase